MVNQDTNEQLQKKASLADHNQGNVIFINLVEWSHNKFVQLLHTVHHFTIFVM